MGDILASYTVYNLLAFKNRNNGNIFLFRLPWH